MILFQSTKGRVVKLPDLVTACRIQLLGGVDPRISYEAQSAIVTRMTINQRVNIQFAHTVGPEIDVYVFGDQMGDISLSGLAFSCSCENDSPGAELMYQWFKTNRASARRKPIRVTLGRTPIEGFVVGFTEDVIDPSSGLVQWGVAMATLPEDT